MALVARVLRSIWQILSAVVFVAGLLYLLNMVAQLWETKRDVATTVIFALDGVAYLLPLTDPGSLRSPAMEGPEGRLPDGPFRYADKHMEIVIKDRELFIDCVSRHKAKPGDIVSVTYALEPSKGGDVTVKRDKLALLGGDTEMVTVTYAARHDAKAGGKVPTPGAARPPGCP